jgi:enamine deaminase RidA (YjgF/YER057c/UK114 family)
VTPEERLAGLGIELPEPNPPVANYVGAVRSGNLVFVSGHGPYLDGEYIHRGRLGGEIDVATGQESARLTIVNLLASPKAEIGELARVSRIVKLLVLDVVRAATSHPAEILGIDSSSSAAAPSRASSRDTSTTRAPSAPRLRAIAWPMPLLAPVTTTTRRVRFMTAFNRFARHRGRSGIVLHLLGSQAGVFSTM